MVHCGVDAFRHLPVGVVLVKPAVAVAELAGQDREIEIAGQLLPSGITGHPAPVAVPPGDQDENSGERFRRFRNPAAESDRVDLNLLERLGRPILRGRNRLAADNRGEKSQKQTRTNRFHRAYD